MSKRSRFSAKPTLVPPEARALPKIINLIDAKTASILGSGNQPIPNSDAIAQLGVGDYAKVCDGPTGERFWCKISGIEPRDGGLRFDGTVASKLARLGFAFGDKIAFEDRHVCQIKPHG